MSRASLLRPDATVPRFWLSLGVLVCLLLGSGPGYAASQSRLMDPIPDAPQAEPFALPDMAGDTHKLSDYRGQFVLVNFWTVSCQLCLPEMSALQRSQQALDSKRYQVLAIHAGPGREPIRELLKLNPVDYTVLIDADLALGNWGVPGLPTTYLIDPKGRRIYRAVGPREWGSPAMLGFLRHIIADYDPGSKPKVRPPNKQVPDAGEV